MIIFVFDDAMDILLTKLDAAIHDMELAECRR